MVAFTKITEPYIDPKDITLIQFEPSSHCNLQCVTCSRTSYDTLLPTKIVLKHQQHISLDLIEPIFKNLPNLKNVKFDGDIGDCLMHPQLDKIIEIIVKLHPKININLHTNMGGGKDETFLKVIQHPNVNIVAGVDGLRDNCSTYRRGSSWKTLEKRFKMIKDHAPNRHHWKMLDFDFNRHQQKEAIELSKKYKFHSMLISPPYGESNNTVNEMILEFENKERTEKGKKRIKYQQRDSIKTLHTFKEAETDITYDEFFAKKENQKMKRNIDTKMNTVKTGRTHSCPWQQATSIQVMSNGTVWPCCWSSDMNKLFEMYPDKVSKKIFYYSQNIELQYTAQDWSVKLGKDWQSNIQVSQNNSLADIMYSKSYKRLKRLLEPRKDKYNIKYCTSACTIFSEKESTGGKLLSRTTDDKDKTDIIITHSGNDEYVWGKVYPIKK